MPLAFVFDEHLRGPLWQAILRRNLRSDLALDVVRVGDPAELRLGATDAEILLWAEGEHRLLVTEDRHTMATHLQVHLRGGAPMSWNFDYSRQSSSSRICRVP